MDKTQTSQALTDIYNRLFARYGPQHWWPAQEPFEVIVGAILTQSAAWSNVEKAINNLRQAGVLSASALRMIPEKELAALIYPCGYYNAKARKLKSFATWLGENFNDDLDKLSATEVNHLRKHLLSIHGIGLETADSIILYTAGKPVFVVDAYTRRIISRIGLAPRQDTYDTYQALFMDNLPHNAQLFNEYHALLVQLGKDVCRKVPICDRCCLKDVCQTEAETEKIPHAKALISR